MSHEWNCACARCERERDWLDAVDDEPEPREPRVPEEGPTGIAAFYSARMA